jgi:hypothetical protein
MAEAAAAGRYKCDPRRELDAPWGVLLVSRLLARSAIMMMQALTRAWVFLLVRLTASGRSERLVLREAVCWHCCYSAAAHNAAAPLMMLEMTTRADGSGGLSGADSPASLAGTRAATLFWTILY